MNLLRYDVIPWSFRWKYAELLANNTSNIEMLASIYSITIGEFVLRDNELDE